MTIDINSIGSGQNQNIGVEKAKPQAVQSQNAAQDKSSSGPSAPDTVTFTGGAEHLRNLESAVHQTTGVDSGKVEAIKSAIENGTFEIDAEKIANKLIELEADLKK